MGYFLAILIALPAITFGETFICVSEAGAGVKKYENGAFQASIYDTSNAKYVLSNMTGGWVLKVLGQDTPLFSDCSSQYFCSHSTGGFNGTFLKTQTNEFTIHQVGSYRDSEDVIFKGHCSKL